MSDNPISAHDANTFYREAALDASEKQVKELADALEAAENKIEARSKLIEAQIKQNEFLHRRIAELEARVAELERPATMDRDLLGKSLQMQLRCRLIAHTWGIEPTSDEVCRKAAAAVIAAYEEHRRGH
jgi:uncharacterized protein (DUF3084 family)